MNKIAIFVHPKANFHLRVNKNVISVHAVKKIGPTNAGPF